MARTLIALTCALAVLATPVLPQTRAITGDTLTLAYEGVLVVKVLEMDVQQRLQPAAFQASAHLKSYGVLSLFKKIDVEAAAEGRLERGSPQPALFHHVNRDGEVNRAVEVRWTGDDVKTRMSVPYPTIGDPLPTLEQKLAAADPLTQLTRIALTLPGDAPCRQVLSFFDGREVYRLNFSPPQPREASPQERAMGLTRTIRCAFTFTEIAGFDRKAPGKQNQGLGQPLSMDLAQTAGNGRWVIAAIRGHTPLGEARVQLRQLSRD